jgi:predicted RNase H-like HicB family nuclease
MAQFAGIIHKDKGSDFGVSFPDFPGCVTAGKTMQEAYDMAREALRGHIDTMAEYGDKLPARPMTLDEARAHPLARGALTFFVVEAHLPSHAKRINITMDEDLIAAIDRVSRNRSEFLSEAARERLEGI